MRDQIATIVWIHKDYNEGYAAADAIMKLVQARIDKLEAELSDADGLLLRLKEVTSAALKGTNK
jgi:hypothetical protein